MHHRHAHLWYTQLNMSHTLQSTQESIPRVINQCPLWSVWRANPDIQMLQARQHFVLEGLSCACFKQIEFATTAAPGVFAARLCPSSGYKMSDLLGCGDLLLATDKLVWWIDDTSTAGGGCSRLPWWHCDYSTSLLSAFDC